MKTLLLTAAFLLITCITSKAQIIAGQAGPGDTLQNSNYYMTIGGSGYGYFRDTINIDSDTSNYFTFLIARIHIMSGVETRYLSIGAHGQWEVLDSLHSCMPSSSSEAWMIKNDTSGSLINGIGNWVNGGYFAVDENGDPQYFCFLDEFSSGGYVGIRKKLPNDTLYGWMKIKATGFSILLESYAYNKGITGI
ncbi:MAG: hypothetical protein V2A54_09890 [Bacteroidota bacterium]